MANQEKNLSPDEMDALRGVSVSDVDDAAAAKSSARVKVMSYNFRQPGRLSAAQLRALTVVHQYFAKRFGDSRPSGMKVPLEMNLLSVETVSYSNFMGSLRSPTFIAQLTGRFDQPVLMEVDLDIVRVLVSAILGDESRGAETRKALTPVEQSIAESWVETLLPFLKESWALSTAVDFGLKSSECDPRFVQVMPDDSPVVSLTYSLQAGELKGQVAMCYSLEPLQGLLEGMSQRMSGGEEEEEESAQAESKILASLKGVPFELKVELGSCSVRASQLTRLQKGDVLCLNRTIHDPVDVFLGESLVFEASLGKKGENLALQIRRRRVNRSDARR